MHASFIRIISDRRLPNSMIAMLLSRHAAVRKEQGREEASGLLTRCCLGGGREVVSTGDRAIRRRFARILTVGRLLRGEGRQGRWDEREADGTHGGDSGTRRAGGTAGRNPRGRYSSSMPGGGGSVIGRDRWLRWRAQRGEEGQPRWGGTGRRACTPRSRASSEPSNVKWTVATVSAASAERGRPPQF